MEGLDWGSVADWAAAIASFLASVTALYLARSADRVKLEGFFGLRMLIAGDGTPPPFPELVMVRVTNVGRRTAKVTTIAIRTGLPGLRYTRFKRRFAIIPVWDRGLSHPLPTALADGESGQWSIQLDEQDWIKEICDKEFASSWLDVETFRVEVHTSNGGALVLKPEGSLKQRMHAARLSARA
jgi:hypothetical protein